LQKIDVITSKNKDKLKSTKRIIVPDTLKKLRDKNIFFILSTGRSGTQTIAKSLSELVDCVCLHEPAPQLIKESSAFRYGRLDKDRLKSFILQTRIPLLNGKVYGESNQTLSLIVPVLAECFPKGKFIWLIRNGLDVVSSIYARQWYSGHSANHDRYEDCPQIEKDWIDGRIMGDLCGDVPLAKWNSMNPFARCCWYWAYVNRTIEQDLRLYCLTDSYQQLKLEHLDRDFPEIIEWLDFDCTNYMKAGRHNKAHYKLYPWQKWSAEEKTVFLYWCSPLMDRLYPDWRILNRNFFNGLDDDSNCVKQYPEIYPQVIEDSDNDDYRAVDKRSLNIYFTPQIKKHPKISVYIPSYNQKNYLAEAIESVLAQTLKPHQIIIVDDCSNDGSQELIAKYAQKFPNLIYPIYHSKNSGVVQTRIDALNAVTGDFVTYVDGDDRFLPEKLELEFDTLSKNPEAQIAYSNNYYINPDGQRIGIWADNERPAEGSIFKETFSRSFPKNNLFRMELINYQAWKSVGFHDPDITIYEDYDMRIRLTKNFKVAFCDVPLSEIRQHNKGLSKLKAQQHLVSLEYIYHKNKFLLTDLNNSERKDVERGFNNFANAISHKAASQLADDCTLTKRDANHIKRKAENTGPVRSKLKNANYLGNNLIFLISQPRAGSTLFQRLLAGHPEIHSTAEPWIMLHPLYALKRNGHHSEYDSSLARNALDDLLSQIPEGDELYYKALRNFSLTLYGRFLELSGKKYFLDKTPRYYLIINELYRLFPHAKFVFLLRNPMAVLSSVLKTWFHNRPQELIDSPNWADIIKGPRYLAKGIHTLKNDANLVRYEDLVCNTENVMRTLCHRINVPYFEEMLDYGSQKPMVGRYGDKVGVVKHNCAVADYVDKWIDNLSQPNLMDFSLSYLEEMGTALISQLGYSYEDILSKLYHKSYKNTACLNSQKFQDPADLKSNVTGGTGEELPITEQYKAEIKKNPKNGYAHNSLAILYCRMKENDKALFHFRKATSINPESVIYKKNLADFYNARLGSKEKALDIYVNILSTRPDDTEALIAIGRICVDLKKYEDAEHFFSQALRADPGNATAAQEYNRINQIPDGEQSSSYSGLANEHL
jgi:glycosyltransferase involved in cell wall biosynthesis